MVSHHIIILRALEKNAWRYRKGATSPYHVRDKRQRLSKRFFLSMKDMIGRYSSTGNGGAGILSCIMIAIVLSQSASSSRNEEIRPYGLAEGDSLTLSGVN
ncbi:hypothetical protein JAAARDRAFT_41934 [Jaapia argillacea MUCL 33604]|uniref:Uncharacterized protein n=1 Tax=Jaapia argillacea MUCL 33604 TaxID=933084 RepID=A0A067P6U9_9AGAM|nr:hypothetical protein JAAARDRAFT_41934 [Jaapia argillacea MUCL 33604]